LSVGFWPFACWDCGIESHREYECLSVMSFVCCQVEVSASGRSFVQRSHTKYVSKCDHEASIMRRPWSTWSCCAMVKQNNFRWWVQITKLFTIQIFTTLMSLALSNVSISPRHSRCMNVLY